ncbi:hypothetical protein OG426_55675 (plasmid) [Streptomyces canus]|uniref:hypothetical protein n=1 Tax=Streptomyces canus TaxID=58343 RepID=UPI00386F6F22|nr:hypothetical protein OG426_55675 [Streptomyces canus]
MMASARLAGGLIDDLEREDDDLGPEPDESEGLCLKVLIPRAARSAGTASRRLTPHGSGGLQCDTCGGWFGVTFWTCGACTAIRAQLRLALTSQGRQPLPTRPTPHERDGRDQPPAPARPHPQGALSALASRR